MSQELSNLGRNLYILLYDKKKSKSDLAKDVGVSQQMISAIVQGDKTPSSATLIKIAKALGVKVDDLIK